jgi:uncharacterized membrane-anchored protein
MEQRSPWMNFIAERTDVLVAAMIVGIVMMMIIPMPTWLLDILLTFNITFALIIIMVSVFNLDPLDFSVFPSLLLIMTLFRLALNISSTRLILLHAYAGEVINTFGSFVVGGNTVVGFIIFLILVVIQFIVITRGAERVSEVAARFTLDAMPGKQMAIDADLNAGLINEDEARERRQKIDGEAVYYGNRRIAEGRQLTLEDVSQKWKEANENIKAELDRFVENTLEYAKKEKDILLGNIEVPALKTPILGRHVLIVVRGSSYKEDLRTISSYIQEEEPVLIGVDGGADALLEFGLKPDIIVGDMDSVSDEALHSGAEIVVHAYANGDAPGLQRVKDMGLSALICPMPGTSEDVAMILAWEYGASLLVAVGTHSNMIDFLEKGRKGMGSTFLVRMKVGSILVDARGVSQLYKQSLPTKYLLQLFVAALIPIITVLIISPATQPFFRIIALQLKLMFNM